MKFLLLAAVLASPDPVIVASSTLIVTDARQASADAVKSHQFFVFAVDHDGVDTDSYVLVVNSAVHTVLSSGSALVNGTVKVEFPTGLPKGTYSFVMKAVGPGGEGVSDPLSLSVTAGNPSNPRNPRIIKGGL